jgi:hypothetical protein
MELSEIQAAIGGPTAVPHQPEGPSEVQPLTPLGLDRTGAEPVPSNVTSAQGAGAGSGGLYPNPGEPTSGTVHVGGNALDSSTGPRQLSVVPGLGALTAGGNFGANRPSGGEVPGAAPVGRDDSALGRDQSLGQGINPALKAALTPRLDGPFGKPS